MACSSSKYCWRHRYHRERVRCVRTYALPSRAHSLEYKHVARASVSSRQRCGSRVASRSRDPLAGPTRLRVVLVLPMASVHDVAAPLHIHGHVLEAVADVKRREDLPGTAGTEKPAATAEKQVIGNAISVHIQNPGCAADRRWRGSGCQTAGWQHLLGRAIRLDRLRPPIHHWSGRKRDCA